MESLDTVAFAPALGAAHGAAHGAEWGTWGSTRGCTRGWHTGQHLGLGGWAAEWGSWVYEKSLRRERCRLWAERTRFELVVGLLLRQFSKLVVSATHPPLQYVSPLAFRAFLLTRMESWTCFGRFLLWFATAKLITFFNSAKSFLFFC